MGKIRILLFLILFVYGLEIKEIGYYDTPGYACGVYVLGSYAYVADGGSGLRVIDISKPRRPIEVGYYDTPGEACGVYVLGSYAYVADGDSGLRIIEIKGIIPSKQEEKKVIKKITPSQQEEKKVIAPKPKYPCDLSIFDIKFYEPSNNNKLDGYEDGEIRFKIENKGKGEGINIKAKITPINLPQGLDYEKVVDIGNIKPQEIKEVRIKVSGKSDLKSGEAKFRIEVLEEYGFDAEPFSISFNTESFKPPSFVIADYGIDDDKEGESYGNNNSIIELGEGIEINTAIQNVGLGEGEDVKAEISLKYDGENIFYGSEKKMFELGKLKPGEYKTIKFLFSTNKRYNRDSIYIKIKITESKGLYGKELSLNLPVNKPTGKGKEVVITGREYERIRIDTLKPTIIDVDKVPTTSITRKDNAICVIFGIEEYKNAPKVSFASRDAQVFYEYAKTVLGIKEKNIYLKINEDATKGEFDKVFSEEWMRKRCDNNTEIIIYFAGHGSPDIERKEVYLIPYDIDPNYPRTGISLNDLISFLDNLKVKSVVMFIDACFSGRTREGDILLAGTRPIVDIKIEKKLSKISLFTASSGAQISSSYPKMKHGLFTYYLLKGLGGDADLDKNKIIYLSELGRYIKEKVWEKARELDIEQTPEFSGPDREFVRLK
ncbi:MAG: caspase family protein [candidate division WOR-3 bacterium]|nr:caspase family protein [candidate division WOR-3 bacterium]